VEAVPCARMPNPLAGMMTDVSPTATDKRASLAPYYLIVFGMSAGLGGVVALLAELKHELGFSDFGIGLSIAAGFATAFIASLVLAPLADRGKSPQLLKLALIAGAVALVVLAIGDQLWHYVLGRAVFGFALGAGSPAARRVVIVADPDHLGRNLGRLGAFDVGGFVVAPLIAVGVTAIGGFRAWFWVSAAFLLLLLPAAFRAQPDAAEQDTERLGMAGLLRIRRLIGALCIASAYFVLIGAFESVWVLELDSRGASQVLIGLAITLVAAPLPVFSPIGGILAQRYGARRWSIGTLTIMTTIVGFYGIIPGAWSLIVLTLAASVVEGLGFPSTPMLVSAAVPEARQAAAQGLMTAVEVATGAVASLAFAAIYGTTSDMVVWMTVSAVMAVLLVGGAVLSRPEDRNLVRPGVPSSTIRRLFR